MDFSVQLAINELFDEPIWFLSERPASRPSKDRLEVAFVDVRSMFNNPNIPFVLTLADGNGYKPQNGQLSPGTFFFPPERFEFGDCVLTNTAFWEKCMGDLNFVDALTTLGEMIDSEMTTLNTQLKAWEMEKGLHCFEVFLE